MIQWLRDEMGLLADAAESEKLARSVDDTGGVVLVPAFVGMGAPYWDPDARGMVVGLTRGTSRAHFVRAALESMAYQSRDLLDAMEKDFGGRLPFIKADGGASANSFLMQFQADMLDRPVILPEVGEVTALGAAYLAGLSCGYWSGMEEVELNWRKKREFEPEMEPQARDRLLSRWDKAVARPELPLENRKRSVLSPCSRGGYAVGPEVSHGNADGTRPPSLERGMQYRHRPVPLHQDRGGPRRDRRFIRAGRRVRVGFQRGLGAVPGSYRRERRDAHRGRRPLRHGHRGRPHVLPRTGEGLFPINVLDRIKACQEVCTVFCATANPVELVVARSDQGSGILGVIDGGSPKGVEGEEDKTARRDMLRRFGYKFRGDHANQRNEDRVHRNRRHGPEHGRPPARGGGQGGRLQPHPGPGRRTRRGRGRMDGHAREAVATPPSCSPWWDIRPTWKRSTSASGAYWPDRRRRHPRRPHDLDSRLGRPHRRRVPRRDCRSLDAPVSGGDVGARNATLTIMVGGDEDSFNAVRPFFEAMGKTIVLQGGPGAGQHAKMANQIAIAGCLLGVVESLVYSEEAGLDPSMVLKSISSGSAGSWQLSNMAPRMLDANFDPGFFAKHYLKDLRIALDAAKEMRLELPFLGLAERLFTLMSDRGFADKGTHALYLLYKNGHAAVLGRP